MIQLNTSEINTSGNAGEFIPILFEGAGPDTDAGLALFFDGPVPEPGDAVEMVCYERGIGYAKFKWRVVRAAAAIAKGEK